MQYIIMQFFRSLKKRKTTMAINIGGYAISMAVLLILVSFIIGEKSVNKGFENGKNIYRIMPSDGGSYVPQTLMDDIHSKVPGVEKICLYAITDGLYKMDEKLEPARFISTNDDFLDMFSFRFIHKSSDQTLLVANNIILTKSFSEKLFGTKNPVGESMQIGNKTYNVVGVVNDVPKYASFRFDALTPVSFFCPYRMGFNTENHDLYCSFLQLVQGVDYEKTNLQVAGMIKHWKAFKDISLSLQPLKKVYFSSLSGDGLEHANVKLLYLLTSIAIVIFFMTIFNYTNLTLANSYDRMNEIGIKKTTGASRREIFRQIIAESLLVSFLSMLIAIVVSFAIDPIFSSILGKNIDLNSLFSQPLVIITGFLLFFCTGILSGIYPAFLFSGMSPLQMISQQTGSKKRGNRESMVAVQFLITTVLIISLLFIQKQLAFVKHSDLGFNKELMVRLDLMGNASLKKEVLKNELLRNPDIVSVSGTSGSPMETIGSGSGNFVVNGEDKMISFRSFGIDEDFLKTFDIEVIKGRNLRNTDSTACLINEHLYKELGWSDLAEKKIFGNEVLGVVKNFHYENLYTEIGNLQIQMAPSYSRVLNIKMQGNIAQNIDFIKKTYKTIEPEFPFSFKFYDDWIQSMYQKEEKQAQAIGLFTLLAIIISCLGLIGTVEHITHKKVKEIGIRKVNGARIYEVLVMLNKGFVKWVVIAFVIATPISYYAMNKWLENFAYKTELSWWVFALAGLLVLVIALLTVSFQSWRAATRNPVEALRNE